MHPVPVDERTAGTRWDGEDHGPDAIASIATILEDPDGRGPEGEDLVGWAGAVAGGDECDFVPGRRGGGGGHCCL